MGPGRGAIVGEGFSGRRVEWTPRLHFGFMLEAAGGASLGRNVGNRGPPDAIEHFVKARLAIVLAAEMFVACGISAGACILRRDEVRAWQAWHDTPTPKNRAVLDRQRHITFRHHIVFAVVLWAGMGAVTVPIAVAVARRRNLRVDGALVDR